MRHGAEYETGRAGVTRSRWQTAVPYVLFVVRWAESVYRSSGRVTGDLRWVTIGERVVSWADRLGRSRRNTAMSSEAIAVVKAHYPHLPNGFAGPFWRRWLRM